MQTKRRDQFDPLSKLGIGYPLVLPLTFSTADIIEGSAQPALAELVIPSYLSTLGNNRVLSLVGAGINLVSPATAPTGQFTGTLKHNGTSIATIVSSTATTIPAVSGATNATPIVITSATHGYATGDRVTIRDVGGNTNANGNWTITVLTTNTFSLNNSSGNSNYTSGGVIFKSFIETDLRDAQNQGRRVVAGDYFSLFVDSQTKANFAGITAFLWMEAFGIKG